MYSNYLMIKNKHPHRSPLINLKATAKCQCRKIIKRLLLIAFINCSILFNSSVFANFKNTIDTTVTSTPQQAIAFIDSIKELELSKFWINIKPVLFLKNLKTNIDNPISIYPGNGTNFCGYGALTYLFLLNDPLGYAKLLVQLYKNGKASFGKVYFNPTTDVKKAAGILRYKGVLDLRPAEQMWYLSLADHFKGYLNFFNRIYDVDDENKIWASVNYAKFNRMLKKLFLYKVNARGADLIHPRVGDQYQYISERMETGKVVLYINNRLIKKKNHVRIKAGFPTHFVVAEKISKENNIITLVYWDYGGKTLRQLSPAFLKRILFGITYCTKKEKNAE